MLDQNPNSVIIAIDGHQGVGKREVCEEVASTLGFHTFDSGLAYRAAGVLCHRLGLLQSAGSTMAHAIHKTSIHFEGSRIFLDELDVTEAATARDAGAYAACVAKEWEVRDALIEVHYRACRPPGLVASGYDMGFVYKTPYRYFLTASLPARARRRLHRLWKRGMVASFDEVIDELLAEERSSKDLQRVRRAEPHAEALTINTTGMECEEISEGILKDYWGRNGHIL